MRLTQVALSNVRNYSALDFQPEPGLNLFIGDNAQGKSNLLEAISLLGTGKSFRTSREADLIKTDLDVASISGEAVMAHGRVRLGCTITSTPRGTRKIYTVNGDSVRYAKFLGAAKVVTFVPADLQLVSGTPSGRRSMLNLALSQDSPQYYHHLARFQKALTQKNALLRGTVEPDPELLAIYNNTLIEDGTQIMLARQGFISALDRVAQTVHRQWVGTGEALELQYRPNVLFDAPTPDVIAGAYAARLAERSEHERVRKASLVGPHRDDLLFSLEGSSLAAYGSQGQQRTAVLALKVAEYHVMHERAAEAPLLLLDDVLSELDPHRAGALLEAITAYDQVFLTATVVPHALAGAARYRIADAQVERSA